MEADPSSQSDSYRIKEKWIRIYSSPTRIASLGEAKL